MTATAELPTVALNLDWLEPEMRDLVQRLSETQRVAATLYGEARSEPAHGIIAVGCVIRNRVKADLGSDDKPDWWGEGYSGVVLARKQFSCWRPEGGPDNYRRVLKFVQRLADGTPATDPRERECIWIAHGIIGDYARDNVDGANHYHTVKLIPRPVWARDKTPVKQIGGHLFYRL